ncbi:MAG: rRNA maturation RNase YbeY [Sedimentisphaerales bacterium]|nr:rRNA maturation RNase YbeY [Sedimentisphaerales bacterium]
MPDKKDASDITVNVNISCDTVSFDQQKMISMISTVTGQFGIEKADINFAVLGDEEIIKLNQKFLNRTDTTDVISFDVSDAEDLKVFDIAVNAEMAQRQACQAGHSAESELALYFLHGLLHNLGFGDCCDEEAAKMHKTEDEILEKFGYGIVYNKGRANQPDS